MKSYHLYILLCSDGSYYTGVTNDLMRRIGEHNEAADPYAYTARRLPVVLVYSQEFADIDQAIREEKRVKGWSHAKKMALIEGNFSTVGPAFAFEVSSPLDKLGVTLVSHSG